ncbi:MAG: septal ring lytic transglycosylase RlpA family protein [Candidatus Omnitrophota bacterium]|jgi:rare lipoprotein A (peptidoglycan hydrolase)
MKDSIIAIMSAIIIVLTIALVVIVPSEAVKTLELRDLRLESDARNTDLGVMAERIMNLESALTFTGKCSWYGTQGEHGRRTSNGEIFDRNELTAAALWPFPKGTMWIVYRPDNGKSVTVRINDTIPARHGRILDLSEAAAERLLMKKHGVVTVKMRPAV